MMMCRRVKSWVVRNGLRRFFLGPLALGYVLSCLGADLPNSKDPAGVKRYAGSEIIAYRGPKFDEFLLPLGPPVTFGPVSYEKSFKVEGLLSRYTYLAPAGRTATEL